MEELDAFLNTKHGKTRYILNRTTTTINSNFSSLLSGNGGDDDLLQEGIIEDADCFSSRKISDDDHVIVFVCGISSHSFSFYHLMNSISKLIRSNNGENSVIQYLRYDKYGRGKSDNPNIEHTVDLFVEQLKELFDEIILKKESRPKITLIGFSMGGCISIHFTSKYSNLVDNLILLSPAGGSWKLPFASSIVKWPWIGNLVFSAVHYFTTEEQRMNSGFFDLNNEVVRERISYSLEMKLKENDESAQISSFANSISYFPLQGCEKEIEMIGKLNHLRVFLMWSLFDLTIPSAECFPIFYNLLKDMDQRSRFVILNNCRHTFFMEREQDIAQLIVNFLTDSDLKRLSGDSQNGKDDENGNDDEKIFDRIVRNVKKQTEPKREIMKPNDVLLWDFFSGHKEFRNFII